MSKVKTRSRVLGVLLENIEFQPHLWVDLSFRKNKIILRKIVEQDEQLTD